MGQIILLLLVAWKSKFLQLFPDVCPGAHFSAQTVTPASVWIKKPGFRWHVCYLSSLKAQSTDMIFPKIPFNMY